MIRFATLAALLCGTLSAQTFTVTGTLDNGSSVSVTAHENTGTSVSAVAVVDGVSCALTLQHRTTTPQGYRHYSGTCSTGGGTKVSILLGHPEGPIGTVTSGGSSGTVGVGAQT